MGIGAESSAESRRGIVKKTSPVGWFPRGKTESYLERKIRMLQEEQGMQASLDETLGTSNRHLSRIEREKRSAVAAAKEATETRKAALVEASWCRILKAAHIPYMLAALEQQKAEKKATEAFNKAAALGVALEKKSHREATEAKPPMTPSSRHKITASLDTAFLVDEEVAAALKSALEQFSVSADRMDDCCDEHMVNGEDESTVENARKNDALTELMLERVRNLQPDQRHSLHTIVATRGLNALLKEENFEQELTRREGGLGDVLVKHVSKLEAEKAAAKQQEAQQAPLTRKKSSNHLQQNSDFPDLGSILVKHVPRIEREKRMSKASDAQNLADAHPSSENMDSAESQSLVSREPLVERQQEQVLNEEKSNSWKTLDCGWPSLDELQPVKKMSKLEMAKQEYAQQQENNGNASQRRKLTREQETANAWGGLDLGSSLKRHISKLEAEQSAWRQAGEKASKRRE